MDDEFIDKIFNAHQDCGKCPQQKEVNNFLNFFLGVLFPGFASKALASKSQISQSLKQLEEMLKHLLEHMHVEQVEGKLGAFRESLPGLYEKLLKDVDALYQGDPAANSRQEVIRSYPGFYAIAAYRLAHHLLINEIPVIPRSITEYAHSKTGIDIHPGAVIGESFCIDHGTGVVIGETTEIGNHVKIYQGVTLGALSVDKSDRSLKRHPTIEDNVVIYAGATILGGETVIGKDSVIGGNVWLTRSVPAQSKVYYKTSVHKEGETPDLIIIK